MITCAILETSHRRSGKWLQECHDPRKAESLKCWARVPGPEYIESNSKARTSYSRYHLKVVIIILPYATAINHGSTRWKSIVSQ